MPAVAGETAHCNTINAGQEGYYFILLVGVHQFIFLIIIVHQLRPAPNSGPATTLPSPSTPRPGVRICDRAPAPEARAPSQALVATAPPERQHEAAARLARAFGPFHAFLGLRRVASLADLPLMAHCSWSIGVT